VTRPLLVAALGDEPLTPLLLARRFRASRVVCVGRAVVQWRVPALLTILRREGCQADWLPIEADDVPAGLADLEARLPLKPGEEVVFDLTNAHGVVGIALYELARRRERAEPATHRLLRIDWSDRLVRTLSPDHVESSPLGARVGLGEFLELHGKRLLDVQRARGSQGRFGGAAARIARALPAAKPLLEAVHQSGPGRPLRVHGAGSLQWLIDELIEDGVLERRRAIFPASQEAFQFLHGRWLEEYLFEVADESGQFDDCASGLRFQWVENGELTNEIDFAGTSAGRATMASCKTGFREVAAPLYELLTLAERAVGRSVVAVFATSELLDRAARQRAAALGIRVVDGERMADRKQVLRALLGGVDRARDQR
jgi:hypothetical protein